jgi:tRNA (cytidine/uridine-2'-O-)-methyltransferase
MRQLDALQQLSDYPRLFSGLPVQLALYQPDLPPNVGTLIRLGACLGVPVHVIEPCGFPFSLRSVRRSVLDYGAKASLFAHDSWEQFQADRPPGRLILLSTKASQPYADFSFVRDDILMVGRETSGVPDDVATATDARVLIPMRPGLRSLNVATAAAMVLGEALRQTGGFTHTPYI